METVRQAQASERMGQLFMALAEELKLPLMHIARSAELQSLVREGGEAPLQDIRQTADMSLQMLDSYLMSLRLCLQPEARLELEPVSVPAVLNDTAQQLRQVAANYGVTLELHIQGRFEPVLAHRQALQSALVSLGHTLIESLPASGVANMRLRLATHRTKYGIVAGVYGGLDELTPKMFRRALELHGHVRQPLVSSLPGSGAGIFVADAILGAMETQLRVGRYQRSNGFAVTLNTSSQLALV